MRLRTLTPALLTVVAIASALFAATEPFASKETVSTGAQAATAKIQALRAFNQEDTAFLQALSGDAVFAKKLFGAIRANDSAGAQALIQSKYSGSTIQNVRLKSDFKIGWIRTKRGGGCVSFCFSSEADCAGGGGGSATNSIVRDVDSRDCSAAI